MRCGDRLRKVGPKPIAEGQPYGRIATANGNGDEVWRAALRTSLNGSEAAPSESRPERGGLGMGGRETIGVSSRAAGGLAPQPRQTPGAPRPP